jgi:hypothetical protein
MFRLNELVIIENICLIKLMIFKSFDKEYRVIYSLTIPRSRSIQ